MNQSSTSLSLVSVTMAVLSGVYNGILLGFNLYFPVSNVAEAFSHTGHWVTCFVISPFKSFLLSEGYSFLRGLLEPRVCCVYKALVGYMSYRYLISVGGLHSFNSMRTGCFKFWWCLICRYFLLLCLRNFRPPGKSHGQRSLVGCSPWGR